jgi:sugar phosphate isomerase/epimerase
MTQSIKGLCLSTSPSFEMGVTDQISLFGQIGFDAFFTGDTGDLVSYREHAEKCGLVYQSVHAQNNMTQFLWENSDGSREMTKGWLECVERCANAGVPIMTLHPFRFVDKLGIPKRYGVENLLPVVELAAKRGVKIAIENCEGEDYLATLLDAFADCDHVGFCWDTGHELCYNDGKDMLSLYGKKLIATHLNDNMGRTDPTVNITWHDDAHMLPLDGIADWAGIMARLRREKYEGILTFELKVANNPGRHTNDAYQNWSAEEFYRNAFERAKQVSQL